MIKIKSTNGYVIFESAESEIKEALEHAASQNADLRGADLQDANLRDADLRDAYLQDANLRDANLRGVKGLAPEKIQPLLMLLDQPGHIHAYKLVNEAGEGPFRGGIKYEIGKSYQVDADTEVNNDCGAGINLATLDWCLKEWKKGYRILIAQFTAQDIAAIPTTSNGKFRVHRCEIVGEKDVTELMVGREDRAGREN